MPLSTNLRRTTLTSADDHDRHFRDSLALLSSARAALSQASDHAVKTSQNNSYTSETAFQSLDDVINLAMDAEVRWNEYQGRHTGMAAGTIDFKAIHSSLVRSVQEPDEHDKHEAIQTSR